MGYKKRKSIPPRAPAQKLGSTTNKINPVEERREERRREAGLGWTRACRAQQRFDRIAGTTFPSIGRGIVTKGAPTQHSISLSFNPLSNSIYLSLRYVTPPCPLRAGDSTRRPSICLLSSVGSAGCSAAPAE